MPSLSPHFPFPFQAQRYESSTDPNSIAPTVGFKVSTLELHSLELSVLDMSGQQRYRKLWECYYQDVQVWVDSAVDSSNQWMDSLRVARARSSLGIQVEPQTNITKQKEAELLYKSAHVSRLTP